MPHEVVHPRSSPLAASVDSLPAIINEAGSNARYAYEGFFFGEIENEHTRTAYKRDVDRFLAHVHELGLAFHQVTPKLVRFYLENLAPRRPTDTPLSAPTKNACWLRSASSSTLR